MIQKRAYTLLAVVLAGAMTSAHALTDQEERDFVEKQNAMQREILLLQMQAKVLEQKAKIAEMEKKINGATDASVPPIPGGQLMPPPAGAPVMPMPGVIYDARNPRGTPGPSAPPSFDADRETEEFSLLSVYGKEGSLMADIISKGIKISVKPGDKLPGGWVVTTIETGSVMLTHGKKVKTVTY